MRRLLPSAACWWAEGLKFFRQPLAAIALGGLLVALTAAALAAGLDARDWRRSAARDDDVRAERIAAARTSLGPAGPANAVATYQLGRGDLGLTRMPVGAGLALGVQRLEVLPVRLRASLDSRILDARDPGPLRNPLLSDAGLLGFPAMVALLLPLAALVLCVGLVQEEREHGRLGLLRVQSRGGLVPTFVAAFSWRFAALWAVAAVASWPALLIDPGTDIAVGMAWLGALGAFCAVWVGLGVVLSWLPLTSGAAMLTALGVWLLSTFAVPAGLDLVAERAHPMPSRLQLVLQVRAAQAYGEDHESDLARDWYSQHPAVPAQLPPVWPASVLPRLIEQDRQVAPFLQSFAERRAQQAELLNRASWLSPGLALVLLGERLAGTDAESYRLYLQQAEAFEASWREFLIPMVMDRRGIAEDALFRLPRFLTGASD